MAEYYIPKNPGTFRVVIGKAGNPIVTNDKSGRGKVLIACKTQQQAETLCEKLNRGDHDGVVRA
jgi:hypothetical protein